jgi:hypothetical protein
VALQGKGGSTMVVSLLQEAKSREMVMQDNEMYAATLDLSMFIIMI